MNKYQKNYTESKVFCTACYKYIDLNTQANEIHCSPNGRHFHDSKYCNVRTMYPARLRFKSHTRKARQDRQAMATYY